MQLNLRTTQLNGIFAVTPFDFWLFLSDYLEFFNLEKTRRLLLSWWRTIWSCMIEFKTSFFAVDPYAFGPLRSPGDDI